MTWKYAQILERSRFVRPYYYHRVFTRKQIQLYGNVYESYFVRLYGCIPGPRVRVAMMPQESVICIAWLGAHSLSISLSLSLALSITLSPASFISGDLPGLLGARRGQRGYESLKQIGMTMQYPPWLHFGDCFSVTIFARNSLQTLHCYAWVPVNIVPGNMSMADIKKHMSRYAVCIIITLLIVILLYYYWLLF